MATCTCVAGYFGNFIFLEGRHLGAGNYAIASNRSRDLDVFLVILWISLFAGTLDISRKVIFNLFRDVTPYTVFQYIARGLMGMKAFSVGMVSVPGVAIHYAIWFTWPALYYAASRKLASQSGYFRSAIRWRSLPAHELHSHAVDVRAAFYESNHRGGVR
jgi:hypothetical protein